MNGAGAGLRLCLTCGFARPAGAAACALCQGAALEEWPAEGQFSLEQRLASEDRLRDLHELLSSTVASGAENAECALRLAWLSYAFLDLRAVEIWAHECARIEPLSAEPHALLGHVFQRGGRYEEAAQEYRIGLAKTGLSDRRRALLEANLEQCLAQIPEF